MRRSLILAVCSIALFGTTAARAAAIPGTVKGAVLPLIAAKEVEVCVAGDSLSDFCTVPKDDGSYVLPGVPPGPAKIGFVPTYRSRLLTQFYDRKSSLAEAEAVEVPEGGVVEGVDGELVEGGVVAGTVTAASTGGPLAEVEACAVAVISPPVKSCDETGAGGKYELHSLPTGYYKVGFFGRGASARYLPWYYDGGNTLAQATPVLVTAGATTTIKPALSEGARVTGKVTAAAGGALSSIPVCLFVSGVSTADRCTESGASGAYSFEGLPGGLYQVGFALGSAEAGSGVSGSGTGGYLPQFYDRVATRAEAQTLLLSGSQAASGVDAALTAPTASVPVVPAPPASVSLAPVIISEPAKPKPLRCKRGFVKKKAKGNQKCLKNKKKKQKRKRSKPKKKADLRHVEPFTQ